MTKPPDAASRPGGPGYDSFYQGADEAYSKIPDPANVGPKPVVADAMPRAGKQAQDRSEGPTPTRDGTSTASGIPVTSSY